MTRGPRTIIRWAFTAPIRLYRRFVSPMIAPRCRYAPTCSAYAVGAIEVHGPIKGLILATWRLLRCNPWSHGGVDRVPDKGRWTPDPWIPPEDWAGNDPNIERPIPMGMTPPPADEEPALVPEFPPANAGQSKGARSARTS